MRSLAKIGFFAAALLAAAAAASDSGGGGGWIHGRATHYGNDGGASIHEGSCAFGHLDAGAGTGHDIAALSDADPDFAGSCGRCYEVACVGGDVVDGYGQSIPRSGACGGGGGATVTVMITDTCPCNYPSNAYSNKRWCCGDARHMDLSYTAFQKLADLGVGVIAARWRRVACPGGGGSGGGGQQHKPACSNWASCFGTDSGGGGDSDGNDGDDSDGQHTDSGDNGSDGGSGGSQSSPSPSPSTSSDGVDNSQGGGSYSWSPSPSPSPSPPPSPSDSSGWHDNNQGSSEGGGSDHSSPPWAPSPSPSPSPPPSSDSSGWHDNGRRRRRLMRA